MAMHTYDGLLETPPNKIYTEHKLGYLSPYFARDKSLVEISTETELSVSKLAGWLRNDFSLVEAAIVKQEEAFVLRRTQVGALPEQEQHPQVGTGTGTGTGTEDALAQLLACGHWYQEVCLENITPDALSKEIGVELEQVRLNMNALYSKLHSVLKEKSKYITELISIIRASGGGHHG